MWRSRLKRTVWRRRNSSRMRSKTTSWSQPYRCLPCSTKQNHSQLERDEKAGLLCDMTGINWMWKCVVCLFDCLMIIPKTSIAQQNTVQTSTLISKHELIFTAFSNHLRRWIALGRGAATLRDDTFPLNSPLLIELSNSSIDWLSLGFSSTIVSEDASYDRSI